MANILVIDDDPTVSEVIARLLRSAGHAVRRAMDGAEGVRLFAEDRPDVVITDIVMPGKEGLETIGELRRCHPDVPIIAMSGYAADGFLQYAEDLGAAATLGKPFTRMQVLQAIQHALEPRPAA